MKKKVFRELQQELLKKQAEKFLNDVEKSKEILNNDINVVGIIKPTIEVEEIKPKRRKRSVKSSK